MKLTDEVLLLITEAKHKSNSKLRKELMEANDFNRITLWRKLNANNENGDLTKAANVAIIAKHLNLPKSKILTNVR